MIPLPFANLYLRNPYPLPFAAILIFFSLSILFGIKGAKLPWHTTNILALAHELLGTNYKIAVLELNAFDGRHNVLANVQLMKYLKKALKSLVKLFMSGQRSRFLGWSKGFGFVRYSTLEGATDGIEGMDGKVAHVLPYSAVQLFAYDTYKGSDGELSIIGRLAAGACAVKNVISIVKNRKLLYHL
ncbi:hypothetical protein L2E82_12212 [Cichorium intybus]|uniref:Uncharacterized protein n=1 Tax=Cichorium intybus TaxID=13427 RepID=A0ACB9GGK2_CICIN|nr:hypothetical protein L2E82_12212 [Cichorium intybus]